MDVVVVVELVPLLAVAELAEDKNDDLESALVPQPTTQEVATRIAPHLQIVLRPGRKLTSESETPTRESGYENERVWLIDLIPYCSSE